MQGIASFSRTRIIYNLGSLGKRAIDFAHS